MKFQPFKSNTIKLFVIVGIFFQLVVITPVRADQVRSQNNIVLNSAVIGGCPMFPGNNIWNTPINNLPVHARSDQWINTIGRNTGFHMDFGSGTWNGGPIGIPYNIVGAGVPKVPVSFYYPNESDLGPYPIPANPLIEYGSDHHILIVDNSTCILYEIYDASYYGGGWHAGSGAIWDLNSNVLRPDTWTSADAAGLPILPGLVRYDEILSGEINHAIRFTAQNTNGYIWPARHLTSNNPNALQIPPMGARFRLKASFDISIYPTSMQVILSAMKTYGIILADNGSNWYISGAPNSNWDNDMLHLLDDLTGNDFEAVDSSILMIDPDSGATGPTISGSVGASGVTLSYVDGTLKTVTSQADGSYAIPVSNNWSGTVTPTHACYIFDPVNRSYSNVTANQAAQNYTADLNPASGCADIDVTIGNDLKGNYVLDPETSQVVSYPVVGGPVVIESTNGADIIASMLQLRRPANTGAYTGISEVMGVTLANISDTYVLPRYNGGDATLYNSVQIANFDSISTNVTVEIAGNLMGTYPLAIGESLNLVYANVVGGPIVIKSDNGAQIIASLYELKRTGTTGKYTGQTQMMALPLAQLSDTYIFPRYNDTLADLDASLIFANADSIATIVTVTIGGVLQGTYPMDPETSQVVVNYPVVGGPVVIESTNGADIIASMLQLRRPANTGAYTGISEVMGVTLANISDTYVLPRYNGADATLYNSVQIANFDVINTNVTVEIGGTLMNTYALTPGQSINLVYAGIVGGPIEIQSNNGAKIIASLYELKRTSTTGAYTGQTQMMAVPLAQLSDTYIFPRYNDTLLDLDAFLIFAVP